MHEELRVYGEMDGWYFVVFTFDGIAFGCCVDKESREVVDISTLHSGIIHNVPFDHGTDLKRLGNTIGLDYFEVCNLLKTYQF